jgi:hypothetical protein
MNGVQHLSKLGYPFVELGETFQGIQINQLWHESLANCDAWLF